jgi:hypothetical protein
MNLIRPSRTRARWAPSTWWGQLPASSNHWTLAATPCPPQSLVESSQCGPSDPPSAPRSSRHHVGWIPQLAAWAHPDLSQVRGMATRPGSAKCSRAESADSFLFLGTVARCQSVGHRHGRHVKQIMFYTSTGVVHRLWRCDSCMQASHVLKHENENWNVSKDI